MVRPKDEIIANFRSIIGDDTGDNTLSFIEDLSDTLDDFSTQLAESGDWKEKYEKNDEEWRKKYRDRFFEGGAHKDDVEATTLTYDDLFR